MTFTRIVEPILTAPFGQFIKIDKNGNPVYIQQTIDKKQFESINNMFEGVKLFLDDVKTYISDDVNEISLSPNQIIRNLNLFYFWAKRNIVCDEVKEAMVFESNLTGVRGKKTFKKN